MFNSIQGTLFALKIGFVLIVAVMVIGFVLFPRQYSIPTLESFKNSDLKRPTVQQEMVENKTRDEFNLRIKKSKSVTTRRPILIDEESNATRRQQIGESMSRENGQVIIEYREANGYTADGRPIPGKVKVQAPPQQKQNNESSLRASAISNWAKKNVVRDTREEPEE